MRDCTGSIEILINDESLVKLFKAKKSDHKACIYDTSKLIRKFVPDAVNNSEDLIEVMVAFATLNGITGDDGFSIKQERRDSIVRYAKSCFGDNLDTYIKESEQKNNALKELFGDDKTLGILTFWVGKKLNRKYADSNCQDRTFLFDIKPDFDFLCGLSTYLDSCGHAFYSEDERLKVAYLISALCEKYVTGYTGMTLEQVADYLKSNDVEVQKFIQGDYSSDLMDCFSVFLYLLLTKRDEYGNFEDIVRYMEWFGWYYSKPRISGGSATNHSVNVQNRMSTIEVINLSSFDDLIRMSFAAEDRGFKRKPDHPITKMLRRNTRLLLDSRYGTDFFSTATDSQIFTYYAGFSAGMSGGKRRVTRDELIKVARGSVM